MTVYILYLLFFTFLIYANGFFRIFDDSQINRKKYAALFVIKAMAVPAFYFLFVKVYGGIDDLDAGKFYKDSAIMNSVAFIDFGEYIKMLFGFQDDSPGSYFYNNFIVLTDNWDNGAQKDFFYNDNRVIIRIHSLIHFFAFRQYFVHALFNCFFSFIGLNLIYKTLKEFFKEKEFWLLVGICFFPTLWLYTGALLKEGWTVFFLGCIMYNAKKILTGGIGFGSIISMVFLVFISLLLKAYLLFYAVVYFTLFFSIWIFFRKRSRMIVFFGSLLIIAVLLNGASVLLRDKSFMQAAVEREREFADLAKGGIFLLDSVKFVRLPYDHSLIIKSEGKPAYYRIKSGTPYTYWEHTHQQDTLYCSANTDTLTRYSLQYELPIAGSNINVIGNSDSFMVMLLRSLYYTTAHPFFFNANGIMQLFASVENLILILSIIVSIFGMIAGSRENFPASAFLFFGLTLFIIIGITTPNSGAILRYRSPAAIFIIVSALYYLKNKKAYKI